MPQTPSLPTLPQRATPEQRRQREFQLSLARTEYNYMRSYLQTVPMSADLPPGEKFSLDFEAQVIKVFVPLGENFKAVVMLLLERELQSDLPTQALEDVRAAYDKLEKEFSILHPERDAKDVEAFLKALSEVPKALENLVNLPKDLEKMLSGLDAVFKDFIANGPTAFLKNTLYDMLSETHGRNYLQAKTIADYEDQFIKVPRPLMLDIAPQPWMRG